MKSLQLMSYGSSPFAHSSRAKMVQLLRWISPRPRLWVWVSAELVGPRHCDNHSGEMQSLKAYDFRARSTTLMVCGVIISPKFWGQLSHGPGGTSSPSVVSSERQVLYSMTLPTQLVPMTLCGNIAMHGPQLRL